MFSIPEDVFNFYNMKQSSLLQKGIYLCFLFLVFPIKTLVSQQYMVEFDSLVGMPNREVLNGILFKENLLFVKDNHPFFGNNSFIDSRVIFKKQPYFIPVKYDILRDKVVISYSHSNVSYPITLISNLLDEFYINKHKFVRLENHESIVEIYGNGFFELLFDGNNLKLFQKYIKKKIGNLSGKTVRYKTLISEHFVVSYNSELYLVKRKRDLIKIFPKQKKYIKNYMKEKRMESQLMVSLISILNKRIDE